MIKQKCSTEKVAIMEGEVISFGWKVEEAMGEEECFASPTYICLSNGNRWRGVVKRSGVFLQLLSAVSPVMVDVR